MKKWIWIFVIFFIILISFLTYTYIQSVEPLKNAEKEAVDIAFRETQLKQVNDFEIYNGHESVSILKGINKNGDKIIVWIPENTKELIVRKESNGISEKEAINKVKQLSNPKEIIDVRLGMEKGIPLWEIYYQSNSNLINYYYIDFETGEWLKKIENL